MNCAMYHYVCPGTEKYMTKYNETQYFIRMIQGTSFQCSTQNTVEIEVDNDVGDVETDPNDENAHQDARCISVGFVVANGCPSIQMQTG